ncbi:uncharacterized protein LOC128253205 [Drosophila gunungcola]|uniref:uncharacterized protein LOC128253205 n=1 Tax=Drosophila gunungcola TaxID=103775 RepID=UPI0022DF49FC|nr:uncharacterized protein LOC128253205 [Drosophila gunungcola]
MEDSTLPTLQNTKLGWIVSGGKPSMLNRKSVLAAIAKDPADHADDDTLAAVVKRFWEIEDISSEKPLMLAEDLRCEQLFKASVEMHGFCDASTAAYGACLYLRSEANGNTEAHLLCAKSRVAPLKALTIPRL